VFQSPSMGLCDRIVWHAICQRAPVSELQRVYIMEFGSPNRRLAWGDYTAYLSLDLATSKPTSYPSASRQ
jgi:hypothetical protein